jgi:hypothetical protein
MASLPNTATTTSCAFTHLLALLTGIVIGKSIDADELNAYRSSSSYADDIWTRIRRQMKSILVGGGVVLGLLVKTGSAAMGNLLGSSSEESSSDGNNADNNIVGTDGGGSALTATTTPGSRWRWR